jgi:predicted amidohydrolase
MNAETFTIALISEIFYGGDAEGELHRRLAEARSRGAQLAVLPELPLNPWSPATRIARDEDAEPPGGSRAQVLAEAAKAVGIGLVGGAIVRDPATRRRLSTALVYDSHGRLLATFAKLHIPCEPGFWESSHYDAGADFARPIHGFTMPIGVQICSDANRPEGTHLLAALGAEAILVPRATEQRTYERWKTVFRANAITSAAYVLSVNRPRAEQDVLIGGPSIAVAPDGQILLETTDTVGVVTLDRAAIRRARVEYPGYLPVRMDLYAAGWASATAPR